MNLVQGLILKAKKLAVGIQDEDLSAPPFVSISDCHGCGTPCVDEDHPHYPSYLKINPDKPLLYSVKPYTRHVLISTGQEDWPAHIDDDKNSLAYHLSRAIDVGQRKLRDSGRNPARILLTNSSRKAESWEGPGWQVIVLPDHIVVNNVTPEQCPDFFDAFLAQEVGQSSLRATLSSGSEDDSSKCAGEDRAAGEVVIVGAGARARAGADAGVGISVGAGLQQRSIHAGKTTFVAHGWLPKAAVMLCSHKKRDKRCGVTAPILRRELTRVLRSKDLLGDGEGDVELWMVSHIGGHKFAGNVIVHRSEGMAVWYGRVEPCHSQAIVEATIERGEVIRDLYRGSMDGSFQQTIKTAW
ncbi:hypothetical protein BGZ70_008356 [Mortierella alpina]|uniref:Sucrase/ferredoxin-like-domain-containing protein n=1 Tax=Mortierella alpina TaxID=64518 RepID=A0A9P6J3N5_MORAP|nr:hypothetical protein BGZ70_008356 [Mortierella alpina]